MWDEEDYKQASRICTISIAFVFIAPVIVWIAYALLGGYFTVH